MSRQIFDMILFNNLTSDSVVAHKVNYLNGTKI